MPAPDDSLVTGKPSAPGEIKPEFNPDPKSYKGSIQVTSHDEDEVGADGLVRKRRTLQARLNLSGEGVSIDEDVLVLWSGIIGK
jgi:hypothetical protein